MRTRTNQLDDESAARLIQEIKLHDKAEKLSDRELASELTKEIWSRIPLWSWAGVVVDEAIGRLRRADTLRRWQERKERRAQAEGQQ